MNRCFKTVFNKARGCLVVCNEQAPSHSKGGSRNTKLCNLTAMVAAILLSTTISGFSFANHLQYVDVNDDSRGESTAESVIMGSGNDDSEKAHVKNVQSSVVIGSYARANPTYGADDEKNILDSVLIGSSSTLTSSKSVGIGANTVVHSSDAVTLGSSSQVSANSVGAIAIGSQATSFGGGTISLGQNAKGQGTKSIAIGKEAQTANGQDESIAIGAAAKTTGTYGVSLGNKSQAASAATAVGFESKATVSYATALGRSAEALGDGALAVGGSAKARADRSTALNGVANVDGSVALGKGAVARTTAGILGYDPRLGGETSSSDSAWVSTEAAVAIGDSEKALTRQIKNLAAGFEDTDAVNVAQLRALQEQLPALTVNGGNTPGNTSGNLLLSKDGTTYDVKLSDKLTLGNSSNSGSLRINGKATIRSGSTTHQLASYGLLQGSQLYFSATPNGEDTQERGGSTSFSWNGVELWNFNKQQENSSPLMSFKRDQVKVGGNRIQGVGDATSDTDAVNLKQLKDYAVTLSVGGQLSAEANYAEGGNLRVLKQIGEDGKINYDLELAKHVYLGAPNAEDGSLLVFGEDGSSGLLTSNSLKFDDGASTTAELKSSGLTFSSGIEISSSGMNLANKGLTGVSSAQFTDGITISKAGINANNTKITSLADAVEDSDAVNFSQLKDYASNSVKVQSYGREASTENYGDSNVLVKKVVDTDGKTNYDFRLNNQLILGEDPSNPEVVGYEHGEGKIQFWRNGDSYTTLNSKGLVLAEQTAAGGLAKFTSEGIDAGNQQIKGVADPEDETDAVNKRYLGQFLGENGAIGTTVLVDGKAGVAAGEGNLQLATRLDETNNTNVYDLKLSDNLNLGSETVPGSVTILGEEGKSALLDASGLRVGATAVADGSIKLGTDDADLELTKEQLSVGNVIVKNDALQAGENLFNAEGLTVGDTVIHSTGVEIAGGPALSNTGLAMNSQKITDLADGVAANDAVNKGQLDKVAGAATIVSVADNNQNLTLDTAVAEDTGAKVYTVKLADVLNFKDEEGNTAATLGKDGLSVGNTTVADNSIKIGDLRLTGESISLGNLNFNATTNELKIGESVMRGDGFRVGNTIMDATGFRFAEGNGPKLSADALDMNGKKIENLAAAIDDTQAVNFGQVKDLISQVSVEGGAANFKAGENVVLTSKTDIDNKPYTEISLKEKISFKQDNHTLDIDGSGITLGNSTLRDNEIKVQDNGSNSYASIKGTAIRVGSDGVNAELTQSSLRVGSSSLLDDRLVIGGVGRNGMTITQGSITAAGKTVAFTDSGIDFGESKLTGLLDGEDVTDAATVGQLQAFYEYVESKLGSAEPLQAVALNEKSNAKPMLKTAQMKAAALALPVQINGADQQDSELVQPRADASAYAAGKNISIQENQISLASDIEVDSVKTKTAEVSEKVTVGTSNNAVVMEDNAIYFKSETGPRISSSGIDAGNTRIQNVADAQAPTDAVNLRQLNQVGGRLLSKINDVDKRAKAGIAQAIATAGLPQAYQPGKAMAAAAAGTFGGESAIAIGVSKISDNGHWVFKGTFSGNTESKFGGSIGVGYQW